MAEESAPSSNFIRTIIDADNESKKHQGRVATRFPPEPNGYLHIGHAKSICLNFGLAQSYQGTCNLRFDDTNPSKEEMEYVESIREDVRWLGFDWGQREFFASDYFEELYNFAVVLIEAGLAYVDSLSAEEIREYRGTLTEPGKDSPHRNRSVAENLDLFTRMRAGEFEDGAHVLRAKIDMASPNINMRDPALYRIKHEHHHRTGDDWCIYPMYDYAHCISDALENITHSICTLEFEDHRPLYDWILEQLPIEAHPQQIEFARLNLSYTVLSKRKLLRLVEEKHVKGWTDPRMPTIAGMRRRGYPPAAIRDFCERIGVAKADSVVDLELFNFCVREDLNRTAPRVMAVLDPVKLVIENFPEGEEQWLEAENNPEDESAGTRQIPFSRELYIEREDFLEDPPKKFFRLAPGQEVRLKHAYYVTCTDVVKDEAGQIQEIRCTYDPLTKGGWSEDGRKVKGTLHWVSAAHAGKVEVRLYDHLFTKENPDQVEDGKDFLANLDPHSIEILPEVFVEPSLLSAEAGARFQFLRKGYFCVDSVDSGAGHVVFNRIVPLKDSWAKAQRKA